MSLSLIYILPFLKTWAWDACGTTWKVFSPSKITYILFPAGLQEKQVTFVKLFLGCTSFRLLI